jgi:LSD1 subclass zinc finger protein
MLGTLGTLGTSFSHQHFKLFKKFGTNLEQLGTSPRTRRLFQVVPGLFQAPKLHQSIANIGLFQLFQLFQVKKVRGAFARAKSASPPASGKAESPMIDAPRLRHRIEVYEVICWRCRRTIELPASARPHRCPYCDTPLTIQWASAPPFAGK